MTQFRDAVPSAPYYASFYKDVAIGQEFSFCDGGIIFRKYVDGYGFCDDKDPHAADHKLVIAYRK